jgi:hypothetical protein
MATKSMKDFKIIYKNSVKFNGRSVDDNVFTVTILATDAKDAERKFHMSRMYTTTNANGRVAKHFRRYTVVRVYHGDGIRYCTCSYCKKNPTMAPAIRVLKTRQPAWMKRNFFGKGR